MLIVKKCLSRLILYLAIGDNWIRFQVARRISQVMPRFRFVCAVHPLACLGKGVVVGEGSVVMAGARRRGEVSVAGGVRGFEERADVGTGEGLANSSSISLPPPKESRPMHRAG